LAFQSSLAYQVRFAIVLAISILAELIHVEYGMYGIAMIFTAHLFFTDFPKLALSWLIINVPYVWAGITALFAGEMYPSVQGFSLLALPVLLLYNNQRGGGSKWEFYIFYIGHLVILYGLRRALWGY
jgi:hypothetical protein